MSSTDIDKPLPSDGGGGGVPSGGSSLPGGNGQTPNVTLTIRMIMSGKEVGSIIGKGGEIINSIREESGAKIHISDGSVPERIVTVTGSTDAILKAFNLVSKKLEDDGGGRGGGGGAGGDGASTSSGSSNRREGGVSLRLIVPASQCGSLIGKGGSKIKEIRESTGATIQVASEMLPNSTERAVTISGERNAATACIYSVCAVMLESPPKGPTIPYTPKSGGALLSGGGGRGGMVRGGGGHGGHPSAAAVDNPLASLLGLGGGGGATTLAALASLAGSQIRDNGGGGRRDSGRDHDRDGGGGATSRAEMSIPNDLIGCIIGKGGSKIAEIRQISGAMIRISKSEESASGGEDGAAPERQITISGSADSVALAKSLINMSLDIHKSKLEDGAGRDGGRDNGRGGGGGSDHRDHRDHRDHGPRDGGGRDRYHHAGGAGGGPHAAAALGNIGGLAQLLAKPEALTALTTLAGLGQLSGLGAAGGLLAGAGGLGLGGPVPGGMGGLVTGVHRSRGGYGSSGGSRSSRDDDRGSRDSKRSKFAPY